MYVGVPLRRDLPNASTAFCAISRSVPNGVCAVQVSTCIEYHITHWISGDACVIEIVKRRISPTVATLRKPKYRTKLVGAVGIGRTIQISGLIERQIGSRPARATASPDEAVQQRKRPASVRGRQLKRGSTIVRTVGSGGAIKIACVVKNDAGVGEPAVVQLKFVDSLLDPPRAGCENSVTAFLALAGPPKIVYVSCEPSTLARDLRVLATSGPYEIESVDVVDMFPQTHHVETVVVMARR